MRRLKAVVDAFIDWVYGWYVTLFGQNGEHDTAKKDGDEK